MKSSRRLKCLLGLAALALSLSEAQAGTTIDTNLPANTVIVNINAQTDGSLGFDGGQNFWYQPSGNAPAVALAAGTYTFRIVNAGDAAVLFPNLSAAQLGQIYTAWTFNSPWTENYLAFASTALANPAESQLFDGALEPGNPNTHTFASAQAAYDGTIANGYYNKIRRRLRAVPGRRATS